VTGTDWVTGVCSRGFVGIVEVARKPMLTVPVQCASELLYLKVPTVLVVAAVDLDS
jgi:hypothetical protein